MCYGLMVKNPLSFSWGWCEKEVAENLVSSVWEANFYESGRKKS